MKNIIKKNIVRNSENQIIALMLNKYEVSASYFVGYGANLRKLRGVAIKRAIVLAPNEARALEIAGRVHNIKESGSLSAGYIVKARKIRL
jgi:hypothetical protein